MRLGKHPHKYFFISFIPILFFFLIQNQFIVNAPYSDDWNAINGLVIRYFSAGDSFFDKLSLIVGQNNEHREGYLSIIAIVQFWIFGNINYKLFDLLGSISILGIFFISYKYILKFKKPRWIILPIAFFLFNYLYYQNSFWAICALQNNTILFFMLVTFYFLVDLNSKFKFALALFFAVLATFTSGNGMLVFISALPLFKGSHPKFILIWLLTFLVVVIVYYTDYVHPLQRAKLLDNAFLFWPITKSFFVYLGSSVSIFSFGSIDVLIASSFSLGFILAAILIKFLIHHFKSIVLVKSNFDFNVSGLLFVLLTMLVYSIGRANERTELVFESRYAITMTVGLCLICLLLSDNQSGNRRVFKYILLSISISFCFLSYTSKLLESVNFNNVVTSNFIKHNLQHREHFFYNPNQGKKVDLANPIISKDYLLPRPKVSLSTSIIGSMTYLNEVIDISFTHQYVKLDSKLEAISRFLISDFSTPLDKEKNHIADFNISTKNNVIFYHNENIKSVISAGSDGNYIVLRNKLNQYWVFNMFWESFDYKSQLSNFDGVCVKNLSGNIPFKYFPDDVYTLRIIKISGAKMEVFGELSQVKLVGI
jgi:hypothetical protein